MASTVSENSRGHFLETKRENISRINISSVELQLLPVFIVSNSQRATYTRSYSLSWGKQKRVSAPGWNITRLSSARDCLQTFLCYGLAVIDLRGDVLLRRLGYSVGTRRVFAEKLPSFLPFNVTEKLHGLPLLHNEP